MTQLIHRIGIYTALGAALLSAAFAPTDDAFADFEAKNPGVLASLTKAQLTDVLLYHVVSGWVGAADLKDGDSVSTALTGKALRVSTTPGVKVNDSSVTTANIVATNGVIHVVDAVLLPAE